MPHDKIDNLGAVSDGVIDCFNCIGYVAVPVLSKTRRLIRLARHMTPVVPIELLPSAAMMPATAVPCPCSSLNVWAIGNVVPAMQIAIFAWGGVKSTDCWQGRDG